MKIMVVGKFTCKIYAEAIAKGFENLQHTVWRFDIDKACKAKCGLEEKISEHFLIGTRLQTINKALVKKAIEENPDLIFIYRGTHIFPQTVRVLKKKKIIVFTYNNDDPFGTSRLPMYWRHYMRSSYLCDHIFVFRQKNIEDYRKREINNVSILKPYYIKEENYKIDCSTIRDTDKNDVVFIGHYENDGRDEYIYYLLEQGIRVKIYGSPKSWKRSSYFQYFVQKMGEIRMATDDYNLLLNGAKIALVFFSKINNDTYTTRCFEIPATNAMMLSEYTQDMNSMYKENSAAVYFRTKEECLNKVQYYLEHEEERNEIVNCAWEMLVNSKSEVTDRAKEICDVYYKIR